jgi:hypothetical protein
VIVVSRFLTYSFDRFVSVLIVCLSYYWPEHLTDEQRKAISKLTAVRLAARLAQIGVSESELEAMDKAAMMQAWALAVNEGRDNPGAVAAAETKPEVTKVATDVDLERQRLEFEMRQWEEERKERGEERQWRRHQLRMVRMAEAQKEQEMQLAAKKAKEEKQRLESPVYQAKLFGDALRGTFARMPSDEMEILPWLRNVEKLFTDFKVSDNLKVHLLIPHLTDHARNVIAHMSADKALQYEEATQVLLHDFKLSSSALLDRFNTITRNANETFTLYGNRLKSVLSYYVESRKAERYDLLIELLVCDRVKSQLSDGALRHVLIMENQAENGLVHLDKLVESLDNFYATHSCI